MGRELSTTQITLPPSDNKGLWWRPRLEVWSHDPRDGEIAAVTLTLDPNEGGSQYAEMTPAEARLLAQALLVAADRQETKPNPGDQQ